MKNIAVFGREAKYSTHGKHTQEHQNDMLASPQHIVVYRLGKITREENRVIGI